MTDVFFFFKSLMGKKLGWKKIANQNMFLGQGSYPNQKVFQYDERSYDMIRSDWKILIFVKSLMGKKLDSIFLIGAKFTKFDLALKKVMKNRSKVVKEQTVLFSIIWLKNCFGFKVLMGTPLDFRFCQTTIH